MVIKLTVNKKSSSMHLQELDDPQKFAEEGARAITWQEYVSRLHELKDEIRHAWHAEDRVTSLKLSIKARFDAISCSYIFSSTLFYILLALYLHAPFRIFDSSL